MKPLLARLTDLLAARRPDLAWLVRWPDGTSSRYGDAPPRVTLTFRTRRAMRRLLREPSLGFGEGYMDGEIEVEGDLAALVRLAFDDPLHSRPTPLPMKVANLLLKLRRRNTPRGARKNISDHYDLGEEFFRLWLDDEMTYSCAYFPREGMSLEEAQRAKHEYLCRKLLLEPGMTLLDIGCGWGALARFAAREYGARVHGITLSQKQADYAARRAAGEGLADRVTIEYADWREVTARYDRVVSVGMFEHVGRDHYAAFFKRWRELLAPGGVSVLHTIGKDTPTPADPWTARYIFPGGELPALSEITAASAPFGLVAVDAENLRLHYAMTLEEWHRRFEDHLEEVRRLYGDRFIRMWRFFLVGSAVGFRYGDLRLWQVTLVRGIPNELPVSREHLYRERRKIEEVETA